MTDIDVARLGFVSLPSPSGTEIRLGRLWETHPAVLLFLRHFG